MEKNEPIEGPKDDVPKEPYPLLSEFVWSEVDADSDAEMQGFTKFWCVFYFLLEVYTLLYENYVEDDDNMFRFDYSVEFLRWYLCSVLFGLVYLGLFDLLDGERTGIWV